MAKQTLITKKRRGPAPTGIGTLIGVRLQPDALTRLDAWSAKQDGLASRPEAIRRLMEIGLEYTASVPRPAMAKPRAKKGK